MRDRVAGLLKEQRLRISTLTNKFKLTLEQKQRAFQQRLDAQVQETQKLQVALKQADQANRCLKDTVEGQAQKIEASREYFEYKLSDARDAREDESLQFERLKDSFQLELDAKLHKATTDLKEQLQVKELELHYRSQQTQSLQQELAHLREEQQMLLENNGDQLLHRLTQAGISMVAYQPGAGHLTIPVDDLMPYMDDPKAYAAKDQGVSLDHYDKWLSHYRAPLCQALVQGEYCNALVHRVERPIDFHVGEGDRCEHHRSLSVEGQRS